MMKKYLAFLAIFYVSTVFVKADVYLQNPRGSNNRLNEAGRERNNANRLFDSQNNNRGGYNVGNLMYYAGSILPIQWTNQHSCNDPNNNCEIIIQYMCSSKIRDGSQTRTIPDNPIKCKGKDCDKDLRYGMHEDFAYYETCKNRRRNKQLFTADQQLKGESARYTRQNAQGTRRGYECPEERDYYPYWYPTPWRDIAILTNDVSRCDFYKKESQNVQSKWACEVPETYLYRIRRNRKKRLAGRFIPISKAECEGISGATWKEYSSHKIAAPDCVQAPWSRDNHNGNGKNGYMNVYNWTVPDIDEDNCALRIRYNISTNDFDTWNTFADKNADKGKPTKIDIADKVGLTSDEAAKRGYEFKNDPVIELFQGSNKLQLQLAINTAQYGRTFQDRSFVFGIQPRTPEMKNNKIYNVNVRGKRGNIVQVYPAVEYDYVPNNLVMNTGDYIHFQWTGSDNNPRNNAGQGKKGTDRSNVILLSQQIYPEGKAKAADIHGQYGRNYPRNIEEDTILGFDAVDAKRLAFSQPVCKGNGDCAKGSGPELNNASPYFDLGARKVTRSGTFFYMCTRNNNFSNRSQKGKIIVKRSASSDEQETEEDSEFSKKDSVFSAEKEDWEQELDDLSQKSSKKEANAGVKENDPISTPKQVTLKRMNIIKGENLLAKNTGTMDVGDGYASDFVAVYTQGYQKKDEEKMTVELPLKEGVDKDYVTVYYSEDMKNWNAAEQQDVSYGVAKVKINSGGLYVARFDKSESQKRDEEKLKRQENAEVADGTAKALENAQAEDERIEKTAANQVWSIDQ